MSPSTSPPKSTDSASSEGAAHPGHTGPYRDERLSLLAENARLRSEIARLERGRAWPTVIALVSYIVLITQLTSWLNGSDPVRYWLAITSLVVTLGAGVGSALRLIFSAPARD